MAEPTKAPSGDAHRRRSFFTSTLVIQPPPASAFVNGPPTHAVLAALSSPRTAKSKTTIRITPSAARTSRPDSQASSSSAGIKKIKDKGTEKKVASPQPTTAKVSFTAQPTSKPGQSSPSPPVATKKSKDRGSEKHVSSPQATTARVSPVTQQTSKPNPSSSTSSAGVKKIRPNQSSSSSSTGVKKIKVKGTEKKAPSSQTTSKQVATGQVDITAINRTAKARAARLVKLARLREEREQAAANPTEPVAVADEPRRTRGALSTSTGRPPIPIAPAPAGKSTSTVDVSEPSSPPNLILKAPKHVNIENERKKVTTPLKKFMEAGFYCQDDHAKSPYKLVSRVLFRREAEEKAKSRQLANKDIQVQIINRPSFPPLPYDYGYKLFFDEIQDFCLPFDIRKEADEGLLDGKKKPAHYFKLKANKFPERHRMAADVHAICRCDPESDCGDNCINRIMSYLCGKDCPCGERCTNKSLAKRKGANVKVSYTGSRGFGLTAVEDVKEGDFVIDYRGEIIGMDTYQERCQQEYAISKNFYALAYDQDEVIDAGARGNEARFINHSCNPNMIVHRYQNLGDGREEYEVGMWALRDIAAGEELTYDYNFDAFGIAEGGARVECKCGAPNCVGYLGRKTGEKSAKQIALDIAAEEASRAKVARIKAKRASPSKEKNGAIASSEKSASRKGKEKESNIPSQTVKAPLSAINQIPTPESMDSGAFDIPPPVDFYKSPSASTAATTAITKDKKKSRQSLPNLSRPIKPTPASRSRAKTPQASSSRLVESAPRPDEDAMNPETRFTENIREYKRQPFGAEPHKPMSGWASWLKKQAGKYPRTEESWQEFKFARRRGEEWMDDLIAEYGRLPSKGIPGQVGSLVSQQLLDQKRRELEQQGIDYTAIGPRGETIVASDGQSVSIKRKRKRPSGSARKTTSAQTDVGSDSDDSGETTTAAEARIRAKQEAIRKRNGAPMGWVYEPIIGPPAQAVDAIPEDLPPRRQRARTISYAE